MAETGINTDEMVDNTEQIYAIYCYHLRKEQRSIFMSDISREDEIIGANVKKFRESQGLAARIWHISFTFQKMEYIVLNVVRQGYPAHMPIYWQTSYIVI